MPGLYTEPTARAKPTNDPACEQYRTNGDKPGEEGTALSYAYQFHCPNDQNLIAVMGRAVGSGQRPDPAAREPPRDPEPRRVHPLQRPDRGLGRERRRRRSSTRATRRKGNGGPNGVGSKKDVVDPRRPRRRLRAAQRHRAPRRRARHLRARDRRLHARPLQGVLQQALRDADVRRGPRRAAELRGRRPRRLGRLPGRRAGDRRAAPAGHRARATTRRSAAATCTTTSRATRGRTATPSTSTTTTSTTTRSASRPTS